MEQNRYKNKKYTFNGWIQGIKVQNKKTYIKYFKSRSRSIKVKNASIMLYLKENKSKKDRKTSGFGDFFAFFQKIARPSFLGDSFLWINLIFKRWKALDVGKFKKGLKWRTIFDQAVLRRKKVAFLGVFRHFPIVLCWLGF